MLSENLTQQLTYIHLRDWSGYFHVGYRPSWAVPATPMFYAAIDSFYRKILIPRLKKLHTLHPKPGRGLLECEHVRCAVSRHLLSALLRDFSVIYPVDPPVEMDISSMIQVLRETLLPVFQEKLSQDPGPGTTAGQVLYAYFPGIHEEHLAPWFVELLRMELKHVSDYHSMHSKSVALLAEEYEVLSGLPGWSARDASALEGNSRIESMSEPKVSAPRPPEQTTLNNFFDENQFTKWQAVMSLVNEVAGGNAISKVHGLTSGPQFPIYPAGRLLNLINSINWNDAV